VILVSVCLSVVVLAQFSSVHSLVGLFSSIVLRFSLSAVTSAAFNNSGPLIKSSFSFCDWNLL